MVGMVKRIRSREALDASDEEAARLDGKHLGMREAKLGFPKNEMVMAQWAVYKQIWNKTAFVTAYLEALEKYRDKKLPIIKF